MQTMKVIEISKPGGPEVLLPAERAIPTPKAGELLIKVAATGVNGPDMMQRKGLYPAPAGASDLLGLEISGEVVAVGTGVTRWKMGDTWLSTSMFSLRVRISPTRKPKG